MLSGWTRHTGRHVASIPSPRTRSGPRVVDDGEQRAPPAPTISNGKQVLHSTSNIMDLTRAQNLQSASPSTQAVTALLILLSHRRTSSPISAYAVAVAPITIPKPGRLEGLGAAYNAPLKRPQMPYTHSHQTNHRSAIRRSTRAHRPGEPTKPGIGNNLSSWSSSSTYLHLAT